MNVSLPVAFLSGSPGMGELLLISAVVLLLFGPKRLPEIARMIGRALDELRKASQDFRDQIMQIDDGVTSEVVDEFSDLASGYGDDDYMDVDAEEGSMDEHSDQYSSDEDTFVEDGFESVETGDDSSSPETVIKEPDDPTEVPADPPVDNDEVVEEEGEEKHDLAG
jgi:sec-independent protein translocase protein TatB